jgi:hypothetical protein
MFTPIISALRDQTFYLDLDTRRPSPALGVATFCHNPNGNVEDDLGSNTESIAQICVVVR